MSVGSLAVLMAVTALGPVDGARAQETRESATVVASGSKLAESRFQGLGCFIGPSASEGIRLKAATIRFQAANGLKQTGQLGGPTMKRLTSGKGKSCKDRPVPTRTGQGRRIVMSQGQNWLWLVKEDGTVLAQGGIVDNDWLPQRTYRTGAQCGKPARSRYRSDRSGGLRIDWFVRFHDCIVGFHQIPVSKRTGQPIHPDYYAGTDLSKSAGCIRMPLPLIKKLYRFAAQPTKVVVTR
ncbi:L,D-transpeptidase family protein [Sporichthya polymorpha]|uniref:L,D-transpeptidase family protein n=1 Tax=Sporichthya polymorpha TaxID=35751 RepID=UPI00146B6EC4|nr:L,D-transpeptidase [Sporichthya polymorpha]